jgi:hypothetical protein
MNINITIQCATCDEKTNCRIGMSNRSEQPLRFCCQSCGSPIDIEIRKNAVSFAGAKQVETLPFDDKTNFVDLHLDYPVSFEKYVMGYTPFLRASQRVEPEYLLLHMSRLDHLNAELTKFRDFKLLINLYIKSKWSLFKSVCWDVFRVKLKTEKPEDLNAALYAVIAIMMFPFEYPGQNTESVEFYSDLTKDLHENKLAAMNAFMDEILNSGFLKNLQIDCLEIYPRILDAELPLRPAFFLDFDEEYKNSPIPMRVSSDAFESYKDLYKDISEIISRQFVLPAGLNNLIKRGNHNAFKPEIGKAANGKDYTPKSLHQFADVSFGTKLDYIDDSWLPPLEGGADNELRNAIAHFKTEYDDTTQTITYYPKREGIKQKKGRQISFLQFMHQLLITYREMHRLHHLVKCLFYYQFLIRK